MQRFFAESSQIHFEDRRIELGAADRNHMKNVLRLKPGEVVWVSDGGAKEYCCAVHSYTDESVILTIQYVQEPSYELPGRIILYQGLPKADKMEYVIQKAVELGAAQVAVVQMKRCVAKLEEGKKEKKIGRWQMVAESAARQSRRLKIPKVGPVLTMEEALKDASTLDVILIPYELEQGMDRTREVIGAIQPGQSVGIFIGPEGGFDEEEIAKAVEAGAVPISLGRRILRTETAGPAILSILMYHLEP